MMKRFLTLITSLCLSSPAFALDEISYCSINAGGSATLFLIHVSVAFLIFTIFIKVAWKLKTETNSKKEAIKNKDLTEQFKKAA